MMQPLLFSNARIICPASSQNATTGTTGWLRIDEGKISAIGNGSPPEDASTGAKLLDCGKAVLAPGLTDMRMQARVPGLSFMESLESLAAAAAAGGITSLCTLPATEPVLDKPANLAFLLSAAAGLGGTHGPLIRLHAIAAATAGLEDTAMAELGLLADAGAIGFSNGAKPIANSLMMHRILAYANMLEKPVFQHAEDPALAAGGEMTLSETSTRLGLVGIPDEAEEIMIGRDLALARMTGARIHFGHVSTARGVVLIRAAKAEGIAVTCDTAPPYFSFNDLAVSDYDTRFRLSPPLRSEANRQAIIAAIADGTIDAIASDHDPCDRDAKLLPFGMAACGASGLETLLAASLRLVHDGSITLSHLLELLSCRPARLLGLEEPRLAIGHPADLVLFDPELGWQVRGAAFASLSASTPFEGQPMQGRVLATWVAGRQVYGDQADDG